MNREKLVKEIIYEFNMLAMHIKSSNKQGFTDINLVSEAFASNLLNEVYGYGLRVSKKVNQAGIDLEDLENKLAIQVTSQKTKGKIQHTLDTFKRDDLNKTFDELYIFITGKKQRLYRNLNIPDGLCFNVKQHIIDFDDLVRILRNAPIKTLNSVLNLIIEEFKDDKKPLLSKNQAQIKREFVLKNRIEDKIVYTDLNYEERTIALYEPVIKFKYREIIVRSALDHKFPESDETTQKGSSTWFKADLYDFYANGLELQVMGSQILFDNDDCWDVAEINDYERKKKYRTESYCCYLRVPYLQIVKLDMIVDSVYGLPTLFTNYNTNHEPFEEIVYGLPGGYRKKNKRILLNPEKRKKLI